MRDSVLRRLLLAPIAFFAFTMAGSGALAQQDAQPPVQEQRDPITNRRISNGEPVVLAFNNVRIADTLDFIVEVTGKPVIMSDTARGQTVTIVNDVPISREEALNLLFVAFLEKNVGVVETENLIRIDSTLQIGTKNVPVIGPDESVLERREEGIIVNKVFRLRFADAETVADVFAEMMPDDWTTVEVEPGTNSIIVLASIGIAKKLEKLVEALDTRKNVVTQTFYLRYGDASQIAERIIELYGGTGTTGRTNTPGRQQNPRDPRNMVPQRGGGGESPDLVGAGFAELRAVADTQHNSVTVVGDPTIVEQIAEQIRAYWDVKFEPSDELVKVYTIQYMDVVVLRNILQDLITGGATSGGGAAQVRPGQAIAATSGSAGGPGRLSDLFRIQADPGGNRLIVIAKTSASFEYFDRIVNELDQPGAGNQPIIIELKHADAYKLAQELNFVFAPLGSSMQITAPQEGLTEFQGAATFESGAGGTQATQAPAAGNQAAQVDFWWQSARARPEETGQVHELIERVRVMPILRQNALMVVGPPHYQNQMAEIVHQLDRPGRQVLITAIIAEVRLEDATSLGLRWGTGVTSTGDNRVTVSSGTTASEEDILGDLFDTSVLDVNVNLNAVLELLNQKTNLRVLSEPRIFTMDNEQANFFDGQTIQVKTNELTDIQTGNLNVSFDEKDVGITLSVRPRITATRDVDLLVNLALSSLNPATTVDDGLIFDLRVTSTRAVLKNGQTIVLSGLLREEESDVKRKVPLLGDIPLIGALFTSIDTRTSRSEILTFVTPIVVDNPDENEGINRPFQDRRRELQRPLKDQVEDPSGASKVWDLDPEAHPHADSDDDGDIDDDEALDDAGVDDETGDLEEEIDES